MFLNDFLLVVLFVIPKMPFFLFFWVVGLFPVSDVPPLTCSFPNLVRCVRVDVLVLREILSPSGWH